MNKIIFSLLILLLELNADIDSHFIKNVTLVNVSSPCDPGCNVEFKINDVTKVSTVTTGISSDDLHELDKMKDKSMSFNYSDEEGAYLIHNQSGSKIKLVVSESSIIDLVTEECFSKVSSTLGLVGCSKQEYDVWDNELNRIYSQLGGSKNKTLRKAQKAWLEYRDAQFTWIDSSFGNKQGSKWGYITIRRKTDIVKNQVLLLSSFYRGY